MQQTNFRVAKLHSTMKWSTLIGCSKSCNFFYQSECFISSQYSYTRYSKICLQIWLQVYSIDPSVICIGGGKGGRNGRRSSSVVDVSSIFLATTVTTTTATTTATSSTSTTTTSKRWNSYVRSRFKAFLHSERLVQRPLDK